MNILILIIEITQFTISFILLYLYIKIFHSNITIYKLIKKFIKLTLW